MPSRMKSICSSWYYCSRSRVTQVEENRKSMIDDGHLLAPSDADLHLQPQLHRRHPLNIEHWFSRCLGRNFITSMCGYYASPSPSLLWISHSLILTVTVILLWFTFYPLSLFLSHLPLSLSLILPPFLLLILPLLLLNSKTYSVYFSSACYKSMTCSLVTFSLFDLKEKTKREYTLKYLTQVAMFSSSNSSLRSSMWEENRGSPFALVKEKQSRGEWNSSKKNSINYDPRQCSWLSVIV